ncbi:MAG: hypothetical protein AAFS10_18345, partial [Myxococcota bacterium]
KGQLIAARQSIVFQQKTQLCPTRSQQRLVGHDLGELRPEVTVITQDMRDKDRHGFVVLMLLEVVAGRLNQSVKHSF